MAALTVATIVDTGLAPTLGAVSSSDTIADDGQARTFLEVANASGGSINATIVSQQASVVVPGVGSLAIADIVVAVPNSGRRLIGPFSRAYINAAGNVTVNFSGTSSVTAGAFRLAKED